MENHFMRHETRLAGRRHSGKTAFAGKWPVRQATACRENRRFVLGPASFMLLRDAGMPMQLRSRSRPVCRAESGSMGPGAIVRGKRPGFPERPCPAGLAGGIRGFARQRIACQNIACQGIARETERNCEGTEAG
jgi:hypothetical protein